MLNSICVVRRGGLPLSFVALKVCCSSGEYRVLDVLQVGSATQATTDLSINYQPRRKAPSFSYGEYVKKRDVLSKKRGIAWAFRKTSTRFLPLCVRLAPKDVGLQAAQEVQKEMRNYK